MMLLPEITFESFLLSGSHQSTVLDFEITIFHDFLISLLYRMGNPKTSIIWKTSDHRAKRSEIWDSELGLGKRKFESEIWASRGECSVSTFCFYS